MFSIDLNELKEQFDIISYFDEYDIDYSSDGKNVTAGWVELECPFCGDDPSMHLGVDLSTNLFSCWRCGVRGDCIKLIQELSNIYFSDAVEILKEFSIDGPKEVVERVEYNNTEIDFGTSVTNVLPEKVKKYLLSRNFDPNYIAHKYKLLVPDPFHLGKYSFRVLVPMFLDGKIVNFVAMDVYRCYGGVEKYKQCSNSQAVYPLNCCWYNIDSVQDKAVLVEGVTDVWRLGDGAIASMGVEFPMEQLLVLMKLKKIRKFYVLYDVEEKAQSLARVVAEKVSSALGIEGEILQLDKGDPGDLTEEEAKELMQSL